MKLIFTFFLGSYIIRKIGPEIRAFKNSVSEKYLSIKKNKKVQSVNVEIKENSSWFKFHRFGNELIMFESCKYKGLFLCNNDDGQLDTTKDKENEEAKFSLKIVKGKFMGLFFVNNSIFNNWK